jgi:hypothetical protein
LSTADGRKFGLTVGVAFMVLGGILFWRAHEVPAQVLGSIGVILSAAGVLIPERLGPVQRAWMGFALMLSKVTTPIFMSIVFFLVVTPIGLAMRLAGRRLLVTRGTPATYWKPRSSVGGRGEMNNQF